MPQSRCLNMPKWRKFVAQSALFWFKSHLPHQNKERRDGVSALFVFVCSLDLFVPLLFVPAAGTAKAKRPGCPDIPDSRGAWSFLVPEAEATGSVFLPPGEPKQGRALHRQRRPAFSGRPLQSAQRQDTIKKTTAGGKPGARETCPRHPDFVQGRSFCAR